VAPDVHVKVSRVSAYDAISLLITSTHDMKEEEIENKF
jgi:hypothetical protein